MCSLTSRGTSRHRRARPPRVSSIRSSRCASAIREAPRRHPHARPTACWSVGSPMLVTVTGTGAGAIPSDGTAAAAVLNLTAVSGTAAHVRHRLPDVIDGDLHVDSECLDHQCARRSHGGESRVRQARAGSERAEHRGVRARVSSARSTCCWTRTGGSERRRPPAGFQYQAIAPSRICDTRGTSVGCAAGAIGAGFGSRPSGARGRFRRRSAPQRAGPWCRPSSRT